MTFNSMQYYSFFFNRYVIFGTLFKKYEVLKQKVNSPKIQKGFKNLKEYKNVPDHVWLFCGIDHF